MKQKLLIVTYLIGLAGVTCWRVLPAVALDTTFTQSIHPIVCTVSTIGVGQAQTVHYSKTCGTVIGPVHSPAYTRSPVVSPSQGGGTVWQYAPPSTRHKIIVYLHENADLYQPGGVTLMLRKDTTYSFRMPSDNTLFPARTLEVLQMTADSISVQFSSPEKRVTLRIGQTAKVDITGDGTRDTMLLLEGFQASDTAFTRFAILNRLSGASKHNEALVVAATVSILASSFAIHLYHRRRLSGIGHVWQAPHMYHKL